MSDIFENIIKEKLDKITRKENSFHIGKVSKIDKFIIEVVSLEDAFFFEKVIIGDNENNIGYVDKIEAGKVVVSLVKCDGNIHIGDDVITTGDTLKISYSKQSMGMIIDPFGNDVMTGKSFNDGIFLEMENPKIPIMNRTAVNRPLETGIAAIDLMYPIGRGQRQLIIGDKKIGKSQILFDTIANQAGKNTICIYVAICKTKKELSSIYKTFYEKGINKYTVIMAVFADDPTPLIKLCPYAAVSIAENYMNEGYDVLVCIDDLKKHADACREIAILSQKNTGRDSYPADIFYTHSRLLEKGGQFASGGSITILPVVETKGGDITDYISTNIISITDGQIVLSDKLFKKGQKPAINYGLSVSRLGGAVQKQSVKKIGSKLRQKLLSYLETAEIYQLVNIDQMSDELKKKTLDGQKIMSLLKQPKYYSFDEQKLIDVFSFVLDENNQVQSETVTNTNQTVENVKTEETPEKTDENQK